MIPILSSLIVGAGPRTGPWHGLRLSAAYVFAMALAYSILGIAAGGFGQNLQTWMHSPWIIGGFSAMFVVFALAMFGLFELQLGSGLQARLTNVVNHLPGGRMTSAAAMGFISALIVGPCVTPPLAGALLYIGQTGDMFLGGLALFSLGIGMGIPLLAVGVLGGSILPKAGAWMEAMRVAFGFILLGVAIWMLSRIIPVSITIGLWGALVTGFALALWNIDANTTAAPAARLRRYGGLLLGMYGAMLLVGAAAGTTSMIRPLSVLAKSGGITAPEVEAPAFRSLKTTAQLNVAIAEASARGRPVLVDFYADWCVSCKELEHQVFADPRVKPVMQRAVLLRSDVTANDAQDRELMRNLDVVGPPTVVFYDPQGEERRDLRLVGTIGPVEFLDRLQTLFGADP